MCKQHCLLSLILSLFIVGQATQEVWTLDPGQAVEKELAGGEAHNWRMTLKAGGYLRVEAAQRGVDVTLVLRGPDGRQLAEMNAGPTWTEELSWEAAADGAYVLEVRAAPAGKGRYELKAQLSPAASEQGRARVAAERLLMEGMRARAEADGAGWERASKKYEEAVLKWREAGERKWEGRTLFYLAATFMSLQRSDQALAAFERELVIARELGDRRWEATTLYNIGGTNQELSRYEQALPYYEQSLTIRRELKDRPGEGRVLQFIGQSYGYMSQFDKSREYCEQSLTIHREAKNRIAERGALTCMAMAYGGQSQYEKALEYFDQALAVSREMKDKFSEAETLNNIGEIYIYLGQYEQALPLVEQALAINREIKNRQREGFALYTLGWAYIHLGQSGKALTYLENALEIYREVKNKHGEGWALNLLGEAHKHLRQYDRARGYYEQALAVARESKVALTEGYVLRDLGEVALALKEKEQARNYYERALSVQRRIKDREGEGRTLDGLMTFWKLSESPRLAIFFGKQAVNAYQEIRSGIQGLAQETQRSFLKSKEATYRTLADLLIAEGRLPEAEQVINLLKQEEYFDFIRRDSSNAPQSGKAQMTPEEAALEKRYREISDQIAELGTERGTLINKNNRTVEEDQRLAKIDADLVVAGNAFQKFISQLEIELGPSSEAGAKAYALRESQGLMQDLRELGAGTVALYTLITDDKYRVILTTPDFQKGYDYQVKAADLNRKVLEFREVLQNPKYDPLPLAQELYRMLLGPVAKDLEKAKAKTLMWSLDGVLRYVPISALHDGKQYLVERYRSVVYTPASQARLLLAPAARWNALGLGVTKAHGARIPALPGVLDEMRGIIREEGREKGREERRELSAGKVMGVLPGVVKLDEHFTQEAMLAELRRQHKVVHIASHFQFQPGNETNSALLLGDGSFLSLAQIKTMPNIFGGVELLTLSACNTATGSSGANGKEVEGFGVLAQRQGAKAVVASLWPVFDTSTKELMQEFYRLREAKSGTSKIEALRQAQIELLRGTHSSAAAPPSNDRQIVHEEAKPSATNKPLFKPDPKAPYAHPYYWAPFILIGNWK